MSFKVVSTCTVDFPVRNIDERIKELAGVEFINKPSPTEEDIITAANDADAVIVSTEPYTKKVITNLKSCRLICTPKMGYDNIDVTAATEAGICVSSVKEASTEEVSDHAMALLLACARRVVGLDKTVRAGEWHVFHGPEMERKWRGIVPIRGQTLGLIGFGRIPHALVPKAKGFGLKILAYDPYVAAEVIQKMEVETVELDYLLKESDFVSVHCALTSENRHMLGAEQFKLMKPTAYIINAARGLLVDEEALFTALIRGEIAGAGLDVVEVEPINMDNPLLKLDNVIFTGHSAHYSDISVEIVRRAPIDAVSSIMSGKWPEGWINPEVESKYVARWGKTA
ncbi:C-terminal binding protein [Chloroflexota bacterium]